MLHLLPGMGATNEQYVGPWRALADVRFHDWPLGDERLRSDFTLGTLAEAVIDRVRFQPGDAIGGSSLGGLVALEIAARLPVSSVVLLGSARGPEELPRLRSTFDALVDLAPLELVQRLGGWSGGPLGEQLRATPVEFLRRSIRALATWEGVGALPCPVHRLHGERDLLIPCPDGVTYVSGAGHVIAWTHAEQCCEWLGPLSGARGAALR